MQLVLALWKAVRVACLRHPLEVSRVSCSATDQMSSANRHGQSQPDLFLSRVELTRSHRILLDGILVPEFSPGVKRKRVCSEVFSKDT